MRKFLRFSLILAFLAPSLTAFAGIKLNGIKLNGVRLNGVKLNGVKLNGIKLNGVKLNGVKLNGVEASGAARGEPEETGFRLQGVKAVHGRLVR